MGFAQVIIEDLKFWWQIVCTKWGLRRAMSYFFAVKTYRIWIILLLLFRFLLFLLYFEALVSLVWCAHLRIVRIDESGDYIVQSYQNEQYTGYIYCIYSSFYYNDQLNHNLHMWWLLIWYLKCILFSFVLLQLFNSFRISSTFDTLDFSIDNFFVIHVATNSLITKEKKFYNVISFLIKYAQCSVRLTTNNQTVKNW